MFRSFGVLGFRGFGVLGVLRFRVLRVDGLSRGHSPRCLG